MTSLLTAKKFVNCQMREADATRKRKTKELISGLSNREGNWRKLQKKRKHMKCAQGGLSIWQLYCHIYDKGALPSV